MSIAVSDLELLTAHCAGDREAFTELVKRHRDKLWSVALRTMRNPEDAADALQDALISAFRRAHTFQGTSQVTTWLYRIVVNACLDRLRREKARPREPLPEDVDRSLPMATDTTPETHAEHAELHDHVAAALARISADQRAALVLVDMEGYSVDEAACALGCAPGTIKSRCARGRAKLAPLLAHVTEAS